MLPTSTAVSVSVKPRPSADHDAAVVFVPQDAKNIDAAGLSDEDRRAVQRLVAAGAAKGKLREVAFDIVEGGKKKFRRVYVVGLGPADKIDAETLRQAAGAAAKAFR